MEHDIAKPDGTNLPAQRRKRRIACLLFVDAEKSDAFSESVERLAEACFRFTPQVAIRPGEAIFMEIGGSSRIFTEESFTLRLRALARRFGEHLAQRRGQHAAGTSRISVADDAATALAMARYEAYRESASLADLPLEALKDFASPFAANPDLNQRIHQLIPILHDLGIQNVKQFLGLPPQQLAARFRKEVVQLVAKVLGELQPAWPGFHPPETIVEQANLEDYASLSDCTNLESILFVMKAMVDRAMGRLRGRAERASQIQIEFGLEKWSVLKSHKRRWLLDLPIPQGSAAGLMPLVHEHLSCSLRQLPLEAPVQTLRFEIRESVPGAGAQRDFFSNKEEESEVYDALVARLAQKLGKTQAFHALPELRYLPERAYRKALEAPRPVQAWPRVPARPSRILPRPQLVQVQGDTVFQFDSGPKKHWKIIRWEGPERLSGEWWRDPQLQGFQRDYYRLVTQSGEKLWVFLNLKSEAAHCYLHGFFD